ncbi:MAG: hypothetical protein Q4F18_12015 [Clostridia bacterium]|nr:hypothetical protein [Clostridia bacterium]
MKILIETIAVTLIYEAFVVGLILVKGAVFMINDYPPAIKKRVFERKLVDESQLPSKRTGILNDVVGVALMLLLFVGTSYGINAERSFWPAFFQAYLFANGISWFDALILDCVWFCHSKRFIIPGTEDMAKDYHDYWFHIRFAVVGLAALAVPAAICGGIVVLLAHVF